MQGTVSVYIESHDFFAEVEVGVEPSLKGSRSWNAMSDIDYRGYDAHWDGDIGVIRVVDSGRGREATPEERALVEAYINDEATHFDEAANHACRVAEEAEREYAAEARAEAMAGW